MNAGEIGTQAGRIFEYNLPSSWIFRSQEDQNDFGIDGEIEIKDKNGKALGKDSVFKVQIKGEENSTYINGGKTLSFNLKIEKIKYYYEFKMPVILVVVEVSSQKIYWLPITNNENLKKVIELGDKKSIQIHIPIENIVIRENDELAGKLLSAVFDCWDYIHVQGLKESASRYASISPKTLERNIEDIGDALFKAHHQKLNNFLMDKKFTEVYQKASDMCKSPIVPSKDRFIALLYYWQAFQIAPFTVIEKEIYIENNIVCDWLILLARENKIKAHKLIAMGKCRTVVFKQYIKQLHATHHSVDNFDKKSLTYVIFNNSTHELYRECSLSLQKIIDLSNRLSRDKQYDILAGLIIDIYPSFLLFKEIHKFRGSEESIEFLNKWQEHIELLVINYCVIVKDYFRIEILYLLLSRSLRKNSKATYKARKLILESLPDFEESLDQIEKFILTFDENVDFNSLSIEEQKEHFTYRAKSLGMDPDDLENEYGRIVNIGLKNYDPSNIMRNCENLFVYYLPDGIVAQSLGMHSVGGIHSLVCLKHGYTQRTGNLLTMLYDNSGGPDLNCSFKQNYCNKCADCIPRKQDWAWNIRWYIDVLDKKKDFLK